MFDVIWTDPDRELVGEHRAKKEIAREQKRAKERAEGSRSSLSTRVSSSSSERTFGFFGSLSLKKAVAPLKSRPSSNSSTLLTPTAPLLNPRRLSPLESQSNNTGVSEFLPNSLEASQPRPNGATESRQNEHISYPSSQDSAASKWTDRTGPTNLSPSATSFTESTKSSIIQPLISSSFIKQNTEVAVSPRLPETDVLRSISEISILADGDKEEASSLPRSPETDASNDEIDFPISLISIPRSPMRSISFGWASTFKPNNPDAWKPPTDWDCISGPTDAGDNEAKQAAVSAVKENSYVPMPLDLRRMKQEREIMANATQLAILERLSECWGDMRDGDLYKELEMEKKRWMLFALHNMDQAMKSAMLSSPLPQIPGVQPRKILVLHEPQATASYLAAIHSQEQMYHLSSRPLSSELFPNVTAVVAPTVSANFPVSSGVFSAVYSLTLPSLVSSQDISQILKGVNRCLAPGATFHLTLIDPMPVTSSLGPHMRAWLEEHLLLNLEKNFRCVNPSRLFPEWLAESDLRGEGSIISTAKFRAITPESGCIVDAPDGSEIERNVRTELRGEVGRMLWKEVWGAYVEADMWWWDEPECVEECLQLGTHWEYSIIEAVKEV